MRPKIPPFKTAAEGAVAVQAYFRQVLHDVPFTELMHALFQSKAYVKMVKDKEPFDPHKLHFSEISSECPALPILSVTQGEHSERELNSYMKSGELHEMALLGVLEWGHPGEFEYQFTPSTIPSETQAHMDAIWRTRKVIFELKSAGVGAKDLNKFPLRSHQLQLGGYVGFMEEETNEDWLGIFLYTYRDAVLEVDAYPLSEHCKEEMALRIEEAVNHLKRGTVPAIPKHFDPEKYPCVWHQKGGRTSKCKMYNYCWGDYQPEEIKPKPLPAAEAQAIADNIATLLLSKQQIKERLKQVEEDLSLEEEKLRGDFDAAHNGVIFTNHPDFNIKEVVHDAREDYDLRELLRRGLIDKSLLEMVKTKVAGSRYIRFVKKKG